MKNFAEFKKFLKSIEGNPEKKVVLTRELITIYSFGHRLWEKYMDGRVEKEVLPPSYIGLVQNNAFFRHNGEELSRCDFGSAKNWSFEGNTATFIEKYGREGEFVETIKLQYRFI
jgi:hypothetical protein